LLNGLEIVTDRDSRDPDAALAGKICQLAMQRGLRVRPLGATIAFSPPLVIEAEEVDLIVDLLGSAMDSL
jgi:4-aminobutyrate aminotransferase-like enzyme